MTRSLSALVSFLIAVLAVSSTAEAQTPLPNSSVSTLIEALFQPGQPFNPTQEPLLSQDEYMRRQLDSREGIAVGLAAALTSYPLGASSAGFTYTVDRGSGAPLLKSVTFGSTYVERALTNGKGVLNVGVSYQQSSFDTLQGIDLKTAGFPVQTAQGRYLLDNQLVGDAWRATLDVSSHIVLISGSYGLTHKLDLGWAIPIASVKAHARLMRDYDAARDYDAFPQVQPIYPNRAGTLVQSEGTADATGLGDMVLRGKFGFGPGGRQLGMISGELRLPTGNEENLLGTGKTSFRLVGGTTKTFVSGAVHVNGGYTFGGLTDELNFAMGAEAGLLPRKQLTVTFDFISQTLRDTVTSAETLVSYDQVSIGAPELSRRVIVSYGFWDRGSATLARAAVGAKYDLGNKWLLTGSTLFRLNDNGYQSKFTALIGIERTWIR